MDNKNNGDESGAAFFEDGLEELNDMNVEVTPPPAPSMFISLYVNGMAAGEVKGVSVDLPMKSIGADEFSFHGCILGDIYILICRYMHLFTTFTCAHMYIDVRYWHKARSRDEIHHYMNRLLKLPDNKPLRGLVGWLVSCTSICICIHIYTCSWSYF